MFLPASILPWLRRSEQLSNGRKERKHPRQDSAGGWTGDRCDRDGQAKRVVPCSGGVTEIGARRPPSQKDFEVPGSGGNVAVEPILGLLTNALFTETGGSAEDATLTVLEVQAVIRGRCQGIDDVGLEVSGEFEFRTPLIDGRD